MMADVYNSQLDAFALYHKIHEPDNSSPINISGPALPALGHALAGSTGAAISNVFTYPLDLIITRLQIQRQLRKEAASPHNEEYKSIRDAASKIYSNEGGFSGLYAGVVQDTSKTIADSFLFFLAYNFLRQTRLRSKIPSSKHLPVHDELSIGFVAGAFSKLLTTPIANIVTRKQTSTMLSARSSVTKSNKTDSVRSIASQIRSEKGMQGFWSGYSASLVLTLNPSLTFFLYETFKRALLPRSQRNNPPASITFLLAAMSKAIASSFTYPFSLAKARAQASSRNVDNDGKTKASMEKESNNDVNTTPTSKRAARSTIFRTILQIAETEGIGALYEGLGGEVLKGFFSHGITMIVKEAVHEFIIQLYYTVLKLLKNYRSPIKVAGKTQGEARQVLNQTSLQTQQVIDSVRDGVASVVNNGKEVAKDGSAQASATYETTIANAQSAGSSARSALGNTSTQVSNVMNDTYNTTFTRAQSTASTVQSAAQNAATQAANAADQVRSTTLSAAGETLSYANEKTKQVADHVGEKIEDLGHSLRPEKMRPGKDRQT